MQISSNKYNIRLGSYTQNNNHKNIYSNLETKSEYRYPSKIVYKISCKQCPKTYTGNIPLYGSKTTWKWC